MFTALRYGISGLVMSDVGEWGGKTRQMKGFAMRRGLEPVERPPLLFHTVQDAIRQYVIDNHLQPGDPLPAETELCRQLNVSRTSVREAIKALESIGLLETRRGSGVFIRPFSLEPLLENLSFGMLSELNELDELLEIREVLETGMIAKAMARLSEEQVVALQDVIERMQERAAQGESFIEEDRRFHQLLFDGLGNRTFQRLLDIFWLTFSKASSYADITDNDPVRTARGHVDILDAIRNGDVEQARMALAAHYAGIRERLARATEDKEQ